MLTLYHGTTKLESQNTLSFSLMIIFLIITFLFDGQEVKTSEDEADSSFVARIKPKTKKVEIDLNSEVERLHKDNKSLEKDMKELSAKYKELELEHKEITAKKPKFGDVRKQTDISKLHQKVSINR